MKNVYRLNEVRDEDIDLVGKKATVLGELINLNASVANGFVISTNAFQNFLENSSLKEKIARSLKENDSKVITEFISSADLVGAVKDDVNLNLRKLGSRKINVSFSVSHDLDYYLNDYPDISLPQSELNSKIPQFWAMIFEEKSLNFFLKKKINPLKIPIGLIIQQLIDPEISGFLFFPPSKENKHFVSIEAVWGHLPSNGKTSNSDRYIVSKKNLEIIDKKLNSQQTQVIRIENDFEKIPVSKAYQNKQKLNDGQILNLAKLSLLIENRFLFPPTLEWVLASEKIYITKINTKRAESKEPISNLTNKLPVLLTGTGVSQGITWGYVRIIKNPNDLKKIKKGEVLVTNDINKDFIFAIKKASSIVTNLGSSNSYTTRIARKYGKPAIVGTRIATKILKPNFLITVNATNGKIFRGAPSKRGLDILKTMEGNKAKFGSNFLKTATKIYLNLGYDSPLDTFKENADGAIINFQSSLQEDSMSMLAFLCENFNPRPIIYNLETQESKIEDDLKIIKKIRHVYNHNNLAISVDLCKTPQELLKIKQLISTFGLHRSPSFKIFFTVDFLSNILLSNGFLDLQIDGIMINFESLVTSIFETNDLTSINPSEINEAIINATENYLQKLRQAKIFTLINLNSHFADNDLIEKLVTLGVNSVSVDLDNLNSSREMIYLAEKNLVTKRHLRSRI